jgi:hypothetical protein
MIPIELCNHTVSHQSKPPAISFVRNIKHTHVNRPSSPCPESCCLPERERKERARWGFRLLERAELTGVGFVAVHGLDGVTAQIGVLIVRRDARGLRLVFIKD